MVILQATWCFLEDRILNWSPIATKCYLIGSTFLTKEVHNAIFQLDKEKAPGPDGFSLAMSKSVGM